MAAKSLYKSFVLNGISTNEGLLDNPFKKVYNILLTFNLFVTIIMILIYSSNSLMFELWTAAIASVFIASMLVLVKHGYYCLSVVLFNLFFALTFAAVMCSLPGEINHFISNFLVLILIAALFVRQRVLQIGLIGLNLILMFGSILYSRSNPPLIDITVHPAVEIIMYLTSAISTAIIGYALINQLQKSEDYIEDLIESLREKNEELNNSNKELEKMTYLATHDLKSPVRTMISFLGLIEKELNNSDLENAKTYCSLASGVAKQMNDLINATLNYSQINCDAAIAKDDVDVNKVVAKIENITKLSEEQIEIDYKDLPTLYSCNTMLYKLLQNLIENGIKYNQSPIKKIRIDGKIIDNTYYLSVEDNGIGIDPQYHEEVFKMYTRLHNNQEYAGTGLGLAICRRICNQIGGDIDIDPSVSEGTRFIITVPETAIVQGLAT